MEGMSQYAIRGGQQLDQKANEFCGRFNDPKDVGYALVWPLGGVNN